ncbi:hypothetical protein BT96DRAFT_946007 [Gymnopus androsaceus JB14]|uniref:Uncharacterized protein n=1 Tax=Gymnopus androsaceus JB14 TaxID=1447944 RepID=A0A6A4GZS9_9AGAR|nr:hypothetical protein BT96DRAFT_946007 [Gymnopus androsaceus JB14]
MHPNPSRIQFPPSTFPGSSSNIAVLQYGVGASRISELWRYVNEDNGALLITSMRRGMYSGTDYQFGADDDSESGSIVEVTATMQRRKGSSVAVPEGWRSMLMRDLQTEAQLVLRPVELLQQCFIVLCKSSGLSPPAPTATVSAAELGKKMAVNNPMGNYWQL